MAPPLAGCHSGNSIVKARSGRFVINRSELLPGVVSSNSGKKFSQTTERKSSFLCLDRSFVRVEAGLNPRNRSWSQSFAGHPYAIGTTPSGSGWDIRSTKEVRDMIYDPTPSHGDMSV